MGRRGAVGGGCMMVTVAEAALMAHRDERTVRRWIAQGLLTEYRDPSGRRVLVLRDVMVVEARVRRGPKTRAMQRLLDVFGPVA